MVVYSGRIIERMTKGITTANGDSLRISGLRIDLDAGTVSHDGVSMTTEFWVPWLEIANKELRSAEEARLALLGAAAKDEFTAKMKALEAEMKASMVVISASSFALDAFYARIKDLAPPPQALASAWRKNNTRRYRQIVELLLLDFAYRSGARAELSQNTESLYTLRDYLVHPPADFKSVQLHPVLKEVFEWRKTIFTLENSQNARDFVLAVIRTSVKSPRSQHKALCEWCTSAERLIGPLLNTVKP